MSKPERSLKERLTQAITIMERHKQAGPFEVTTCKEALTALDAQGEIIAAMSRRHAVMLIELATLRKLSP